MNWSNKSHAKNAQKWIFLIIFDLSVIRSQCLFQTSGFVLYIPKLSDFKDSNIPWFLSEKVATKSKDLVATINNGYCFVVILVALPTRWILGANIRICVFFTIFKIWIETISRKGVAVLGKNGNLFFCLHILVNLF